MAAISLLHHRILPTISELIRIWDGTQCGTILGMGLYGTTGDIIQCGSDIGDHLGAGDRLGVGDYLGGAHLIPGVQAGLGHQMLTSLQVDIAEMLPL